jgi:hypothetical protein
LAEAEIAEERKQPRTAALHPAGQRMAGELHRLGAGEIANLSGERGRIKSPRRDEVEPSASCRCTLAFALRAEMIRAAVPRLG